MTEDELRWLVVRRRCGGAALTGIMKIGIVLGAAVILVAPLLTAIYVRWANRSHDASVKTLRDRGTP